MNGQLQLNHVFRAVENAVGIREDVPIGPLEKGDQFALNCALALFENATEEIRAIGESN